MEISSSSKAEVIKPMLLKAGIPLALSLAGFVFARIMANQRVNPKESLLETDDQVSSLQTDSPKFRDEDGFHSLSTSTCMLSMEDHEPNTIMNTNVMNLVEILEIRDNKPELEEQISCLRIRLDDLQNRESVLEMQFISFCRLKEQESVLMEHRNMLLLEMANVEFLDREVSSMEAESQRLEKLIVEYFRVLEQLEYWKSENGLLERKVKKLLRKTRWQSRIIREKDLKLEAREAEILRINDALDTRINVVKKLGDEIGELRLVLDQVQDEKNVLLEKLELAEESASSISKIEGEGIKTEDYTRLEKEFEKLQKDRAAELKELICLRWTNACLRHKLMKNQVQQVSHDDQGKNNNLEIDFEGSREIGDYGLEDELAGMVLEHNEPCFGTVGSDQASSKRRKLFQRLKRWVEGSEKGRGRRSDEKERHEVKCFGRHSVSEDSEEHHHTRRSCSSA